MSRRYVLFWVIGALVVAATGPVQAKEDPVEPENASFIAGRLLYDQTKEGTKRRDHDTEETTEALRALFAVANVAIPTSSSCSGNYGQTGKATMTDILVSHLSGIYPGGNYVIQGNCQSGQCAVIIRREAGEDASMALITFDVVRGKASVPTLQCLMTP